MGPGRNRGPSLKSSEGGTSCREAAIREVRGVLGYSADAGSSLADLPAYASARSSSSLAPSRQ
ncbi:hypothetical protein SSAG_04171 [Streptomyces sp. Mg1]|nr:hypothetical protein SSAG_04171 [Streptomyces sp. Mg1]